MTKLEGRMRKSDENPMPKSYAWSFRFQVSLVIQTYSLVILLRHILVRRLFLSLAGFPKRDHWIPHRHGPTIGAKAASKEASLFPISTLACNDQISVCSADWPGCSRSSGPSVSTSTKEPAV